LGDRAGGHNRYEQRERDFSGHGVPRESSEISLNQLLVGEFPVDEDGSVGVIINN
jgi:hypothetical protein